MKKIQASVFFLCCFLLLVGLPQQTHASYTLKMPVNSLGIITWYTFDNYDVSGTSVVDDSGNGHTGTKVGSPALISGVLDHGLSFGTGNYFDAAITYSAATSESYSFWVKFTSGLGSQHGILSSAPSGQPTSGGPDWLIVQNSSNKFSIYHEGSYVFTGNTTIQTGKWYYVVIVRNVNTLSYANSTNALYINGVLDKSATTYDSGTQTSGYYTYVGSGYPDELPGALDDVRIYNRVLSAAEILNLYQLSRGSIIGANPTFAKKTIYLTKNSGSTWKVPNDWNATGATIEAIGPGGNGGSGTYNYPTSNGGSGGGGQGGGYGKAVSPTNIKAGENLTIQVGAGGSTNATFVKDDTGTKIAQGDYGASGESWNAGFLGGSRTQTNISTGGTAYSGGSGGNGIAGNGMGGAGGGGSAGPHGNGAAGGANTGHAGGSGGGGNGGGVAGTVSSSNIGGNGGAAWDGTRGGCYSAYYGGCPGIGWAASNGSGGGGADSFYAGQVGGNGSDDWSAILIGAGGGGGGSGYTNGTGVPGGNGGQYGGGGGGGSGAFSGSTLSAGGTGGDGVIVITYTPKAYAVMNQTVTPPNLANGLVGHWTFDGPDLSTATAYDTSGQGNNGSLINTPKPVTGVLGQALSFNGTNQWIRILPGSTNTIYPNVTNAYTISFWYNSSNYGTVLGNNDENNGNRWIRLSFGAGGVSVLMGDTTGNWSLVWTATAVVPAANKWELLTVTWDGSTVKVYKNGVLGAQTAHTGALKNFSGTGLWPVIANYYETNGSYYSGNLDDFRIYGRALSASEVMQLYNLGH